MELENTAPEASTDTPELDRRAILEQGFEAAEKGEPIEPVVRDSQGRFTKPQAAEPKQEAPAEEKGDLNTLYDREPVWKRPPASWRREFHEVWQKADPKLQEYAWKREEEMRAGIENIFEKAQFADSMQGAIQPYMNTIQGLGLTPDKAVAALMEADHKLRTSDPQTRQAYFMQLAQSYGINLNAMPQQAPGQQGAAPQQAAPSVDPLVWQLQNELNQVRGEVMGWKQQQEMMENQTLLNEINQFSLKADHFDDARPAMIQLLQSGLAQTLEEAYEKAIRLDPNLFEQVTKAQQAEVAAKQAKEQNRAAKTARAAAVSVRSATPGVNTAPKSSDRRALLEEAFAEAEQRL
jgi:hypothetical protein